MIGVNFHIHSPVTTRVHDLTKGQALVITCEEGEVALFFDSTEAFVAFCNTVHSDQRPYTETPEAFAAQEAYDPFVACEHEWHKYGTVNGREDVGCQKCGASQH